MATTISSDMSDCFRQKTNLFRWSKIRLILAKALSRTKEVHVILGLSSVVLEKNTDLSIFPIPAENQL